MGSNKDKSIKHTKESCRIAAKKCKTRNEFKTKYRKEYASAHYNGWFEEIVSHMPKQVQTKYATEADIKNFLNDNINFCYKDLPPGLIKQAKKLGLTDYVKSKTNTGVHDSNKYRRPPNQNRPKTIACWENIISEYGLFLAHDSYKYSKPDKSGRKYKMLELRCSKKFIGSKEQHPSFDRRITNIERDLKNKKLNCPYCISPNWVSNKGDSNRRRDIERLIENVNSWCNKHLVELVDINEVQAINSKCRFREKSSGEIKLITLKYILSGRTKNPFTRGDRLNDRFKIKYEDLKSVCDQKNFKLLISKVEYEELTKPSKNAYSPSTRRLKFSWYDTIYEAPIGTLKKANWFPQDFFYGEEIVRYALMKFFRFKFEFPKAYPKNLKNKNGHQLELDGYCENVYGFRIAFEHQGKQHYSASWNGCKLVNIKENDKVKRKWCKDNSIILIEIRELGNKTKIIDLSKIFANIFRLHSLTLNDTQIDTDLTVKEINKYLGNKINKRFNAIQNKLKKSSIDIQFNGIDSQLKFKVKISNALGVQKHLGLATVEKWDNEKIMQFAKKVKKN